MTQYTPRDNDSDCDEFDIAKIEAMEVELIPCPSCGGRGIKDNGFIWWTCVDCAGSGEKEGKK